MPCEYKGYLIGLNEDGNYWAMNMKNGDETRHASEIAAKIWIDAQRNG